MRVRRSRPFSSAGLWLAVGLALVPSSAEAGPVEQLAQVMLHPAQPDVIALRYDYGGGGLVISRDGGRTFELLCSDAMNLGGERLGRSALAGDGRLLLGTFNGMVRDEQLGCGFAFDPGLAGRWVTDVIAHPADPEVMFAVTGRPEPEPNGVFVRRGGGDFEPQGAFMPGLITRLRAAVLDSGALRLYASAVVGVATADFGNGEEMVPNYVLRVSDDGGETWSERTLPPSPRSLRLEAVDPTDPDRIVVTQSLAGSHDVVLISEDAGRTFSEYAYPAAVSGVVIAPDGRVFIADVGNPMLRLQPALWHARSLAVELVPQNLAARLLCLAYDAAADRLLACQPLSFGVLAEDGSLQPLLDLRAIESLVSCAGSDVAAACAARLRAEYCHVSHFPCAPVCERADASSPEAADYCGDAGVARASGSSEEDERDSDGEADGGAGDAGARGQPPEIGARADYRCSARAPLGANAAGSGWASAAGLLAAAAYARRRSARSARAPSRAQRVQRSSEASSPPPGNR